jgi:endonuclease YncB( thermonuclease family)
MIDQLKQDKVAQILLVVIVFVACVACFFVGGALFFAFNQSRTNTPAVAQAPPSDQPVENASEPLPPPTPESTISKESNEEQANQFVEAQVINVVDGDTIDVLIDGTEYRIRYILIDTPETHHPTKGEEPFGPEATEANRTLVEGKIVKLEKDVSDVDQYDRLLRYVYVDDIMVNEELLRQGLAKVATYPPDVKYVDRFLAVQKEAQAAGRGIWGEISSEEAGVEEMVTPTQVIPTSNPEPNTQGPIVVITELNARDEYVDIQNVGTQPQDITGWTLRSEKGEQDCKLSGIIEPGQTLRIWARQEDAGQDGFNCGYERNIWNNDETDPAVLFDTQMIEIDRQEYKGK